MTHEHALDDTLADMRQICLTGVTPKNREGLLAALLQHPGIEAAEFSHDGHSMFVRYFPRRLRFHELEDILDGMGVSVHRHWRERLRMTWDELIHANKTSLPWVPCDAEHDASNPSR